MEHLSRGGPVPPAHETVLPLLGKRHEQCPLPGGSAKPWPSGTASPQLQLLQPMQRAACLILERIEESLARANDQARAPLVLLSGSYMDRIQHTWNGSPFSPAFARDIATRLSVGINGRFRVLELCSLSTLGLGGQDFLHACLSIHPVSGKLEPEDLCEAGARLRLHQDEHTGKPIKVGNESEWLEGARKRAARFKKIVNERVARNEEERAVLAWVHEDPIYGKSGGVAVGGEVGDE